LLIRRVATKPSVDQSKAMVPPSWAARSNERLEQKHPEPPRMASPGADVWIVLAVVHLNHRMEG
jgi:hypothetical protein